MKPKNKLRSLLLLSGISLLAISSASAATLYWDSNGNTAGFGNTAGTWGTSTFWSTSSAGTAATANTPTTSADTVNFGTATLNYSTSNIGVVAGGVTVGNIIIGAAQTTNINLGTASNSVTIYNGITKNSTSGNFIFTTSPVILAGSQTWTNNTPASTVTAEVESLRAQAGINYGANTFTIDGVGVTGFTGGAITGSGNFIQNGTGTVVFNAGTQDNSTTFTGNIFLNGGVARFQNTNNLGSGNININGGILEGRFGQTLTRTQGTAAGEIQITGGISGFSGQGGSGTTFNIGDVTWGSGTFNPTQFLLQSATTNTNGNSTFQSNIDLGGATRTIRSDQAAIDLGAGIGTFSGNISNGAIIKEGAGQHVFAGTNTYAGGTTINSGILRFNTTASMPDSGKVTVNDGATLGVGIGGTGWTTGTSGVGTLGGLLSGLGGAGTSSVAYNENVGLLLNVTANSTYSGDIANPTGATSLGLTKVGGSSLVLSGNNTYSGVTTLGQGVLSIGSIGNAGSNSTIGNFASAGAAGLVLQGGSLTYTGGTATTNRGFTYTAATAATITVSTAGAKLTMGDSIFNHTANQTLTVSGGAGSSLDLSKLTYSNSNKTITANIAVNIDTVEAATNNNLDVGGAGLVTIKEFVRTGTGNPGMGGSGTVNITETINSGAGNFVTAGGIQLTYSGTSFTAAGLTINGTSNFIVGDSSTIGTAGTFAGATGFGAATAVFRYSSSGNQTLTGNITGAGLVSVSGSGTLTMSGNNKAYSGATNITSGRLAVTGTTALTGTTGDVNINGGAFRYNSSVAMTRTVNFTSGTLEGTNWTGTLSGLTIGTGRTISPGNSPGTATTGSQTWAGGGSYLWEMNDATGDAGYDPGWDLLSGTGTLTISATDLSQFNILVTSLTLANLAGDAVNFSDLVSYAWLIADFANPISGFSTDAFNINTSAFANTFTGTFDVALGDTVTGGDNSQIYLTYSAIPEPRAALLGGLGMLLLLRRRRS